MKNHVSKGKKYNSWTVLELLEKTNNRGQKKCFSRCDCGVEREVTQYDLKSGRSKSCGCLAKNKNGNRTRTHNLTKHPLYPRWKAMVRRCHSPSDSRYKFYGARGIKVCGEWLDDPKKYIDWFYSQSYDTSLTVDRIDTYGDYSPNNCRLITQSEQLENLRPRKDRLSDEIVLKIRGMSKNGASATSISKELNVSRGTVYNILKRGYYKDVK